MGPDQVEEHDAGYDWRGRFPGHTVTHTAEGGVTAAADDLQGWWVILDEGAMADLLDAQDRRGLVKILRFASRENRDAELAARVQPRNGLSRTSWPGSALTEAESVRMNLEMGLLASARESMEEDGLARSGQERTWGRRFVDHLRTGYGIESAKGDVSHTDLCWDWTRPPGRFDLAWTVAGGRGAAELKIRKPDELIWDLVKLAEHAGFDGAAFQFAAICVQVEPSDLNRGSGALLAGTHAGVQRPRDWIERWTGDWRWLMCGGRGIRPNSLPRQVVLGEPRIIGDRDATHWRVVSVTGAGPDGGRDDLDAWGWPHELGPRPDGWQEAIVAAEAPRGAVTPQAMIDCAGYEVPARFKPRQPAIWLAEHYPRMTGEQRHELLRLLRDRGWTERDFAELLPGPSPSGEVV